VAPAYGERRLGLAVVLGQRCDKVEAAIARAGITYPFPILCDEDRQVIRRYGVWHPIGLDSFNTAHPASFLIDGPTSRVRYAFVGRTQFARAPLAAILDAAADTA
jgi:peroxiredoxin